MDSSLSAKSTPIPRSSHRSQRPKSCLTLLFFIPCTLPPRIYPSWNFPRPSQQWHHHLWSSSCTNLNPCFFPKGLMNSQASRCHFFLFLTSHPVTSHFEWSVHQVPSPGVRGPQKHKCLPVVTMCWVLLAQEGLNPISPSHLSLPSSHKSEDPRPCWVTVGGRRRIGATWSLAYPATESELWKPTVFDWVLINTIERTTWGWRKNPWKAVSWTMLRTYTKLGTVHIPTSQNGKTLVLRRLECLEGHWLSGRPN